MIKTRIIDFLPKLFLFKTLNIKARKLYYSQLCNFLIYIKLAKLSYANSINSDFLLLNSFSKTSKN